MGIEWFAIADVRAVPRTYPDGLSSRLLVRPYGSGFHISASASTSSGVQLLERCRADGLATSPIPNLLAFPSSSTWVRSREIRSGRAPPDGRRPAHGTDTRRTGAHGRRRRHHAGRRHWGRSRHRHHDGPHLAAGHGAFRLRPSAWRRVITASGTLAQLIPPSLVLIVLASRSEGLRRRALPRRPHPRADVVGPLRRLRRICRHPLSGEGTGAARSRSARHFRAGRSSKNGSIAIVPPMLLIVAVLGAIFQGIATPSEVGAVGAVVAALLALFNRPPLRGRSSATPPDQRPTSPAW